MILRQGSSKSIFRLIMDIFMDFEAEMNSLNSTKPGKAKKRLSRNRAPYLSNEHRYPMAGTSSSFLDNGNINYS